MSGKIVLRALKMSDAAVSWQWRNKEEIRYFYSGHPFYINEEKETEWLRKIILSDLPLSSFGIEEVATEKLVGMAFLKDINLIHRTAEFAIFIGDSNAAGKGYAREATQLLLAIAFNELNLNRIYLKVQQDNINAKKLYEKCGFTTEGTLRQAVYKNGRYVDEQLMSILKQEYLSA